MFGQPQFAALNARINDKLSQVGTLVVAHRGSGHASIADNTELAVRAALRSGADVIEIDVAASRDGEFYCFHDGDEAELLGVDANLQTLSAAEIDKLSYQWVDRPGRRTSVERLLPLLETFRGQTLFNIDRSWWRWPQLLRALRGLSMADQLILKCPAWDDMALARLREFGVKYPFVPICASPDDVYRTVGDPALNTVGVELITTTQHHPWFSAEVIEEFHRLGVFCFVNTETLTTGVPLFGGLDDELAILQGPDTAYGPLFDLGVDAVQTDWPWLVRDYRQARRLDPDATLSATSPPEPAAVF
ncbi:MAG: glycerophosphodiester phosphodiesterase family protein [Propionicimonas sp.]|nr:glycerophosphodiester phosphodiesterase family protein [Propionicimonas sp.]